MKARLTKECIDRWFKESPWTPLKLECDDGHYSSSMTSIQILTPIIGNTSKFSFLTSGNNLEAGYPSSLEHYPSPYQPEAKKLYAWVYPTGREISFLNEDLSIYGTYTRAPEYDIEYNND